MADRSEYSNTLLFSNSTNTARAGAQRVNSHYLVYFLPGNPGLIQFYKTFLHTLHELLSDCVGSSTAEIRIDVLGITLPGFECGPLEDEDGRRQLQKKPVDLDGQLDFLEEFLKDHAGPDTKIILMGHSMGAYLVMELLRRNRSQSTPRTPSVVGTIGLFPAVVHLAQSPGGRRARRLLNIPLLPFLITIFVRILGILPARMLHCLVELVLGYPDDAAMYTLQWLQSPWGFIESLHLLREELDRINADAWNDDVWGSGVYLPFGDGDSYTPDAHRDSLIRARASNDRRTVRRNEQEPDNLVAPCMEFAAAGIPHDFAIRHSAPVAEWATSWIMQILARDGSR